METELTLSEIREYLLAKKGTTEEMPFGPEVLVFKVLGKMFALVTHQDPPLRVSLKCDPDLALTLRAEYESVISGYHLNKKHWNTVTLGGDVPADVLRGMMDLSYNLVVKGLKASQRKQLAAR